MVPRDIVYVRNVITNILHKGDDDDNDDDDNSNNNFELNLSGLKQLQIGNFGGLCHYFVPLFCATIPFT